VWLDGSSTPAPLFTAGADVLFVAYYASAELGCYLALNWPIPARVLDLYVEFRKLTNGIGTLCGDGLLGALTHFGLDGIDAADKESMRNLALRGGHYSASEQAALLDYCQSDVDSLVRLLPKMLPTIDLPRALLRGRYMAAAARMEWTATPIDVKAFRPILDNWDRLRTSIARELNRTIGVFVPTDRPRVNPATAFGAAVYAMAEEYHVDPDALAEAASRLHREQCEATREKRLKPLSRLDNDLLRRAVDLLGPDGGYDPGDRPLSFSTRRFAAYLIAHKIPWPQLESGNLNLSDDTFREMARAYPERIGPIREIRHTLGEMRLNDLAVGPDGRNRVMLSAFRSRTGRNQPSNSKFIFGPSTCLRSLICPGPGRAIAYVDWSQQELGIAAALSGDRRMQDAYTSGDFYLTFAKMAGAVPPDATKQTHGRQRDQFKTVSLGVLYGLGAESLARKIGEPTCKGRELLDLHHQTFRRFWKWLDSVEAIAMLTGRIQTVFGWTLRIGPDTKPTAVRNFPMQANGAEMMRLAACLATERGISICCPVHDAFLIEADENAIESATARMQNAMREASEIVLSGFTLKTDAKIVRHPDHYSDLRGEKLWGVIHNLLREMEINSAVGSIESEKNVCTPVDYLPLGGSGVPHPSLAAIEEEEIREEKTLFSWTVE
jgi:hypothetical protein